MRTASTGFGRRAFRPHNLQNLKSVLSASLTAKFSRMVGRASASPTALPIRWNFGSAQNAKSSHGRTSGASTVVTGKRLPVTKPVFFFPALRAARGSAGALGVFARARNRGEINFSQAQNSLPSSVAAQLVLLHWHAVSVGEKCLQPYACRQASTESCRPSRPASIVTPHRAFS